MSSKEHTSLTLNSSKDILRVISLHLKSHLEERATDIFTGGEHYLIEVKEEGEASRAWQRETLEDNMSHDGSHIRLIHRMMGGVIQKRQKELFPWVTFCFKPALIDEGDGQTSSFLNLKAIRNVSRKLWAMIRIHQPNDEKRAPELCCYVGRHLPGMNDVIEPQLKIPFKNQAKLVCDERSGVALPAALFSDNPNLGNPLQSDPLFFNLDEAQDGDSFTFTLSNISDESVTICEIGLRDFDEDDSDELQGVEITGLDLMQVIEPHESVEVTLSRLGDQIEDFESLFIGYCEGEVELDDDDLMADEELVIKLQGNDESCCHVFLFQGEGYNLIKRALLDPQTIIEEQGEDFDLKDIIQDSLELNDLSLESDSSMLMLNEADLEGGSVGTLSLKLNTTRPQTDFADQLSEDVDPELTEEGLLHRGESAIPISLKRQRVVSERSKSRKTKMKSKAKEVFLKENAVILDLIYLGQMNFYNHFQTPDQGKLKDFLLNCVAVSSLIRILKTQENMTSEEINEQSLEVNIL